MAKSASIESFLTRNKVAFEYLPTLPVGQIDVAKSLRNQARFTPLSEELVERYAEGMRQNAEFPALIGYRDPGTRKVVLITGNHRTAAANKVGRPDFDIYLVSEAATDGYIRDLLTRTANTIEGKNLELPEAMAQAMHLVRVYDRDVTEMAHAFGIGPSTLYQGLRREQTLERLAKMGKTEKVPVTVLDPLHAIQNDNVLGKIHDVAVSHTLSAAQAHELKDAVRSVRTEAEQIKVVEDYANTDEMKRQARESAHRTKRVYRLGPRRELVLRLQSAESTMRKYPTRELAGLMEDQDLAQVIGLAEGVLRRVRDYGTIGANGTAKEAATAQVGASPKGH